MKSFFIRDILTPITPPTMAIPSTYMTLFSGLVTWVAATPPHVSGSAFDLRERLLISRMPTTCLPTMGSAPHERATPERVSSTRRSVLPSPSWATSLAPPGTCSHSTMKMGIKGTAKWYGFNSFSGIRTLSHSKRPSPPAASQTKASRLRRDARCGGRMTLPATSRSMPTLHW